MIHKAHLKYGYSKFSLEILEYCEPDEVLLREQYYLDSLSPEYNILKIAGSLRGFKHSEETIRQMKSRIRTEEQKAKHLEQLKRLHSSAEHKEHLKRLNLSQKGTPRPEGAGVPSVAIEVFDTNNNETTVYVSISEAARAIGVAQASISGAFKRKKPGVSTILIKKKRYKITKLSSN